MHLLDSFNNHKIYYYTTVYSNVIPSDIMGGL